MYNHISHTHAHHTHTNTHREKRRDKNIRGTTPKVAMLADVIESHSAISSVYQCMTGPNDMTLCHSHWMYWTLFAQQNPLNLDDLL